MEWYGAVGALLARSSSGFMRLRNITGTTRGRGARAHVGEGPPGRGVRHAADTREAGPRGREMHTKNKVLVPNTHTHTHGHTCARTRPDAKLTEQNHAITHGTNASQRASHWQCVRHARAAARRMGRATLSGKERRRPPVCKLCSWASHALRHAHQTACQISLLSPSLSLNLPGDE